MKHEVIDVSKLAVPIEVASVIVNHNYSLYTLC
ncbi:unnamed protein product, partial [marine sediment metagenome]